MYALIFPGQGAHRPEMLEGFSDHPEFARRYATACDYAGKDPLREYRNGEHDVFDENRVASLMTVLASTLSLDLFHRERQAPPAGVAGYSIGQWTAMYASGMLGWDQLMQIVCMRAELLDGAIADRSGAMAAVIGIREEEVEKILSSLRADGESIYISNYNCPGQVTIAGTRHALARVEARIRELRPRKWQRLVVAGAWHCPLVNSAASRFRARLDALDLKPARWPVIDNVTGDWLPSSPLALRDLLARQISSPVQWERGIRRLISHGCRRFIEIGYERTLSKFMFFIDRSVDVESFHSPAPCMAETPFGAGGSGRQFV